MPMSEKMKATRAKLKALSAGVQALVKSGAVESVNSFLVNQYKDQTGASEFKTFNQWKETGKKIIKGSTAFLVWGKPRDYQIEKTEETTTDEDKKMSFFPVCYLFSNLQVD